MMLLIKAENEKQAFDALKARNIDGRFLEIVGGGSAKVIAVPQRNLDAKVFKWFAEDPHGLPLGQEWPTGALLWFRA